MMLLQSHQTIEVPAHPAPVARGPLSRWVVDSLADRAGTMPNVAEADPFGDDCQLALYLCYEPHFGPLAHFSDVREWDPQRLAFCQLLEGQLERGLRDSVAAPRTVRPINEVLRELVANDTTWSLSRHMEASGTLQQMRDVVMHRSAYQLKEGDAHTLAVPRLVGRAKQLLVRIQAGEYGADAEGRRTHAQLFAMTMQSLGLSSVPNAYINELPASAFAISNLISMFGLNRRWRGALVGHLAIFEMTSVEPMRRYANALERLGVASDAGRFYRVHTVADIEHETMSIELAEELLHAEPELRGDVIFGAQCVLLMEERFAASLRASWAAPSSTDGAGNDPTLERDTLDHGAIEALLLGEPWFKRN
jgi:hypothetical protein